MKQSDYKTRAQAIEYQNKRFSKGLEVVHLDEMNILREFLKYTQTKAKKYLDIGTGTGRIVSELLKVEPKRIYVLDSSPAMLSIFKETYHQKIQDGSIKILLAPSEDIPLPNKSVDFITGFHLFKHLKEIKPTLKECHRILCQGGYIAFDALNANSVIKFNLGTCYALSESLIANKLTQNGFKVIKIISLHPLGETVYNLPVASIISSVDKLIRKFGISFGTKLFILAQKNV